MKKSKKLLYMGALAIGFSLSGCSDSFLDMTNYGSYEDFDSPTRLSWYVSGLYDRYFYGYSDPRATLIGSWQNRSNLTEEAWGVSSKLDGENTQASTTSDLNGNFMSGYFGTKLDTKDNNNSYSRIRQCNVLLQEVDGLKNVTDEEKRYAKGQALFLRAMQLFDLVRTYGPVPIVTTVINAEITDNGYPRSSVTKCMEQIVKDLDAAAGLLPDRWPNAKVDYGRLTRIAALAYKSRVLLTYASPVFNKDWDNPQNQRWALALEASKIARSEAEKAGYGLGECSDAAGWEEMMGVNNNSYSTNKEALIVRLHSKDDTGYSKHNGWEKGIRLTSQGGNGGVSVPMGMIDLFPMADGTQPTEAVKVANGSMDFILNRDPRFYRTFGFSGVKWGTKENANAVVWAYQWFTKEPTEEEYSTSGSDDNKINSLCFVRKMSNAALPEDDLDLSNTTIYEYRFAELVLNLAECYAATGNPAEAVKCIGEIRGRVGIPSTNNYGLGTINERHQAIAACLRERQIELAFEGKRSWDMWRWLLYDGGQEEPLKLSTVNTCTALGLAPMNGTHRDTRILAVKDYIGDADPLVEERAELGADLDSPEFQTQLQVISTFYKTHFYFAKTLDPVDADSNKEQVNLKWMGNYYINGLDKTVLDNNEWLGQTIGWSDQNQNAGTIHFQDDEIFTLE